MQAYYATRSTQSSQFAWHGITHCGLGTGIRSAIPPQMFNTREFLQAVLSKAGSQAALARALELPSSRIAEYFKPDVPKGVKGKRGPRRLTMAEGIKLSEVFGVPPFAPVNAAMLTPVLQTCLQYAPGSNWSDQAVERLAEDVEYGLRLLQSFQPNGPSQDAIDVASRALADRVRQRSA